MFKLGVYRLDQYQPEEAASGGWEKLRNRFNRNRIGFHLFRAQGAVTPQQIALFEKAIASVRLSSGVYRTTFPGRFRGFDEQINDLLATRFDTNAQLRVEDWAASDCLASSEWTTTLFPRFPHATLAASDLTLFLVEVALPQGESFIMETNGEPLQYIRPPFVICLFPSEPRILLVNSFLESRARTKFESLRRSWQLPQAWLESEDNDELNQPPLVFRKIPLIHPKAQALRSDSTRFRIHRHSVFDASATPCDVIRTMNIYNLSYFSGDRLREGVRTVARSLRPGGVWIVGRTFQEKPPLHNASIFVREADSFHCIGQVGAGSEIEDLVLAERLA